jgi:Family of unknown function (DUF5939)
MFFPPLSNLRKRQISEYEVDILDWWLGTRKKTTLKYLNPLQFSIDCNIDVEHAIKLFSYCTLEDSIDIFEIRYVSRCPNCKTVLKKQEGYFTLSKNTLTCPECGLKTEAKVLKDEVEVYFSLTVSASEFGNRERKPVGVPVGKAESLQGSMIKSTINNSNTDLGGLFACIQ